MHWPKLKLLDGDVEHPFDVGLALTLVAALVSAAIAAGLIAFVGFFLHTDAKGTVVIATALAGFATVAVGLALSIDAYRGLRSAVNQQTAPAAQKVNGAQKQEVKVAGLPGLSSADLSTLLPQLIRTAAGIAIAVLLLGCLLLATASVTSPSSASATPTTSASPAALVQP
jgi:hypothetical protein